jgi:hypothetical protein
MTTIDYHEFLFYNLTQLADTKHPLKELPYDDAFGSLKGYYKEFCESKYNDELYSEYDAITNFLEWY